MTRILQVLIVLVLVLVIGGMVLTVSGKTSIVRRRNEYRKAQLQTIFTYLDADILTRKGLIPAQISTKAQQIGIATSGCEIHNTSCSVDVVACTNLHIITGQPKKVTLPADLIGGDAGRTLFAVQLIEPNTIQVTACGAEAGEKISMQKSYPNLRINPTPFEADSDAREATSSAARIDAN